jgi:hypothetical protein
MTTNPKGKYKHINLNLTQKDHNLITKLAKENNVTMAKIIKDALKLLSMKNIMIDKHAAIMDKVSNRDKIENNYIKNMYAQLAKQYLQIEEQYLQIAKQIMDK